MKYIDLHVHSNASDGTLSPSRLIGLAAEENLAAVALTDHDTIAGIKEAKKAAAEADIELIPGIELSCMYQTTEIHILGLYIREADPVFSSRIAKLLKIRNMRNEEMLQRFQADGINLTMEDLWENNPDTVITRAHFARQLVKKGYASSLDQAFGKYLQYGGRYCFRKEFISPEHAMGILRENHAFPSLAHIMLYKLGWEENEKLIRLLKDMGLMGLEVYHSSHHKNQCVRLQALAKTYGLLPTGGSDFHGENKPDIRIGRGRGTLSVPYSLLEPIKALCL